jgi:regulator of sirC expression with transglutaminase-like and TPR domain
VISTDQFAALVARPTPPLDRVALAIAAAMREVDAPAALAQLDALGAELAAAAPPGTGPEEQADALTTVLGGRHGFGDHEENYDDRELSLLDAVLATRRGLPILLSVVYMEAARRARWPVWGVGLAGHFVIGHFGAAEPIVLDPYRGGRPLPAPLAPAQVRPWPVQSIAARMLSNLVRGALVRHDLATALTAADLRDTIALPEPVAAMHRAERLALRARMN